MPLPHQAAVDAAINMLLSKENPTLADLNHIQTVSRVQEQLIEYVAKGSKMTPEQLIAEQHDSTLLAKFMTAIGDSRPHKLCDCHAIISGGHPAAAPLRAVMAILKIRIDFPVNGSWLPKNTAAVTNMPKYLSRAIPHSRIHRKGYYRWLSGFINLQIIKNSEMLAQALRKARFHLETSSFPSYVMLPASKLR